MEIGVVSMAGRHGMDTALLLCGSIGQQVLFRAFSHGPMSLRVVAYADEFLAKYALNHCREPSCLRWGLPGSPRRRHPLRRPLRKVSACVTTRLRNTAIDIPAQRPLLMRSTSLHPLCTFIPPPHLPVQPASCRRPSRSNIKPLQTKHSATEQANRSLDRLLQDRRRASISLHGSGNNPCTD